ncbi:PREDICTED: kinase suppressor of Ras 1 isoform X14 [Cercocebus atys]|nr:PREDICTED: kinase suppressor of Ras 1 isoform X14 [Cercocebus atys]
MVRRDIGLSVTHRFSTKSWLSQVCHVCQKSMIFGVKCKHCRLKCHNKCTKEAPACRISFLPLTRLRRTESVPSDINNPVDRAAEPHFGTLPKALTKKEHPPAMNHLDSSSNPSSTTSSTPSSPAPFPTSSNPSSATTPPNPSPGQRDSRFNFPAAYFIHHRQQFIFPDISAFAQAAPLPEAADGTRLDNQPKADVLEAHEAEAEEPEAGKSEAEDDEDEVDDLPSSRRPWRGPISRKASQTSVYLQEWDIPFEQVELGEPIGQGRWGRVHRGRWHGEVAIRLLEMDGHNQDHLKLFKKEVMNYRQTRHENVVLFMGACMNPPHLAIITSFCKGRTLHSFVRDPKTSLDINKTRQIAQEIIKGMGYLHAKGIVHKDLKSKNVFYDNGKVVITDFGLFGISGVVREGRRENQLKLSHDWLCYLAPEIVREMTPGKDEDQLPFSKAADVYAFGTVWYELQARDWPLKNQAAEASIWQIGSGEGMKRVLASVSLGKEVSEILSACWAFNLQERPSFSLLMDMLEKLPKLNRRLSHPGHFWKSAEELDERTQGLLHCTTGLGCLWASLTALPRPSVLKASLQMEGFLEELYYWQRNIMVMESADNTHGLSLWEHLKGIRLQILVHLGRAQEGREVQTHVWPWGTCHPLEPVQLLPAQPQLEFWAFSPAHHWDLVNFRSVYFMAPSPLCSLSCYSLFRPIISPN